MPSPIPLENLQPPNIQQTTATTIKPLTERIMTPARGYLNGAQLTARWQYASAVLATRPPPPHTATLFCTRNLIVSLRRRRWHFCIRIRIYIRVALVWSRKTKTLTEAYGP